MLNEGAECWSLETSLAETCLGETNLVSVSVSTRQSLGESLSRSRQTPKSRGSRDRTVYFIESFQAVSIFVSAKQKGKSLGSCLAETKLRKVSVSVSRDNFSVSINTLLGDDAPQPQLFLVDDFTLAMDKTVANIYNVLSHHNKLHIVSLVHRLFSKLPHFRDISMACSHLCLKKNPRDLSEYQILARQLHPTNPAAFMAMFKHATARGFGYLLCDLTQTCKDTERFLTNILPEEYPPILYILDNTAAAPK